MMTEVWLKAGPDAKDIFLIQQLESVLTTVTDRVKAMQVGEVVLIDGGDGRALPQHIASLPAAVAAILREFRETTGVDVIGALNAPAGRGEPLLAFPPTRTPSEPTPPTPSTDGVRPVGEAR